MDEYDDVDFVVTNDPVNETIAVRDNQFPQSLVATLGNDSTSSGELPKRTRCSLGFPLQHHGISR
jgi:hypothetical protein